MEKSIPDSFVQQYAAACTRVAAGDLTPEELAHVERMRPLFAAALTGKSWDELQVMKARLEVPPQPEPEADYVAVDEDIPFAKESQP